MYGNDGDDRPAGGADAHHSQFIILLLSYQIVYVFVYVHITVRRLRGSRRGSVPYRMHKHLLRGENKKGKERACVPGMGMGMGTPGNGNAAPGAMAMAMYYHGAALPGATCR